METVDQEAVNAVLALLAPGTELRDGLERIVRGRTGALIVLGNDRTVEEISTGGFELNVDFSSTRLRELAKMDGAVVLSTDGKIIEMSDSEEEGFRAAEDMGVSLTHDEPSSVDEA